MLKQYKLRFYNFRLVIFLLAISVIGIVLVGSAREDLKSRQLVGVILGLIIMVILSLMDYSWISNFQWIMYGFNLLMLIGVRLFGSEAGGASRWLDIGGFRFQPTELSKVIIILFFAKFFMDHEEDLNTFKTLAKSVILLAIPLFLIYEQPDMKNTLMLLAVFCILIYIAGLSYKIIGGMFLIIIPLAIIFVSIVVQPDQKLIKEGYKAPIHDFVIEHPESGDITQEVLEDNGYTFLVIAYNINKTDPENQEKLNRLAAYAKDKGYRFYGLSASAADDIRKYTEANQVNYDYCSTDEIQLKTIVRSNPGLILLRQGTILDKWGHRDLPEVEELQNKDLASYCLQEQQAITDRYLIYSLIMLYIACIFLYIIRKYKRMIK